MASSTKRVLAKIPYKIPATQILASAHKALALLNSPQLFLCFLQIIGKNGSSPLVSFLLKSMERVAKIYQSASGERGFRVQAILKKSGLGAIKLRRAYF